MLTTWTLHNTDISQIICEEGQVIPADARLICDYDNPEAFAEYQEMHLEEEDMPSEAKDNDEDGEIDEEDKHHGMTIVACDQSAITGESLAVDKYMVRLMLNSPARMILMVNI